MDIKREAPKGTVAVSGNGHVEPRPLFRRGLVFKAHRLLYHPTLGLRVIKKKKTPTPAWSNHKVTSGGASWAVRIGPLVEVSGFELQVSGFEFQVSGFGFRMKGLSKKSSTRLIPAPCTRHPAPCTLHPAPRTLHPAPCTLRPEPCTLYPVPCTLHPNLVLRCPQL